MNKGQLLADAHKLKEALNELPEPLARPCLIVISGLPGTGKSYFSRTLAERWPCLIVESDALRKTLFPVPSYNARESQRLFQALHLLTEEFLSKGIPVLLDATNLVEYHREHLYRIADRLGLKLIIVRVEAPAELVRERLQRRAEDHDPQDGSDAGWAIYLRMKLKEQQIRRHHFVVNTGRDITPVINKIIRDLKR
jgi:predicted kinase